MNADWSQPHPVLWLLTLMAIMVCFYTGLGFLIAWAVGAI